MKQLAYITQGHSEYDPALRELLDATGIDAEEFVGLDYFSLIPFFVLAGATVTPDAHTHGTTSTSRAWWSRSPRISRRASSPRCRSSWPTRTAPRSRSGRRRRDLGSRAATLPARIADDVSSAVTTRGSNWVPEQRCSSSTAAAIGIALRYERVVVMALKASQTATIRAASGISSPARPSG